jgi:hypothetical protein
MVPNNTNDTSSAATHIALPQIAGCGASTVERTPESDFLRDVAGHAMVVIRNDGVYRHIRFAKPGTNCMHFDLITWPGYLCYTGDMGTYVFTRLRDMFEFFRRSDKSYRIDMRYWAEKCEADDKGDGLRKFSYEKFQTYIREWVTEREEESRPDDEPEELVKHTAAYAELRAAVEDEVVNADDNSTRCYDAANDFRHDGEAWRAVHGETSTFEFSDLWDGFDSGTHEYTHRFVWCCYALAWGIEQFDKATAPVAEEAQS